MALQAFLDDFPSSNYYPGSRNQMANPLVSLVDSLKENMMANPREVLGNLPDVLKDLDAFYERKEKRILKICSVDEKTKIEITNTDTNSYLFVYESSLSHGLNIIICIHPDKNKICICGKYEREKRRPSSSFESYSIKTVFDIPDGKQQTKLNTTLASRVDIFMHVKEKDANTRRMSIRIKKRHLEFNNGSDAFAKVTRVTGDKYQVTIEFPNFIFDCPKQLSVHTLRKKLYIYVKHSELREDYEEIYVLDHTFLIPHGIDDSKMVANVNHDNVLIIEAPKHQVSNEICVNSKKSIGGRILGFSFPFYLMRARKV